MSPVDPIRISQRNDAPVREAGAYVLYWMIASRRVRYNAGLERAVALANEHKVGLVILEALRVDYRWASERIHSFVIDGMADNAQALSDYPVTYFPYVEPLSRAGSGLLEALTKRAVVVVTDDFPCFFLPRMVEAAANSIGVRLEAVDSNGIYPMAATERTFTTAASFRRHLQKELRPFLASFPLENPLSLLRAAAPPIDASVLERWPMADPIALSADRSHLTKLPIDHSIKPITVRGGSMAAGDRLELFLESGLERYGDRNHPDADSASQLSPYLHFGFFSAHEIFQRVMHADGWDPSRLADKATGSRAGWWGASAWVESFLDELITWREIGYNMCHTRPDYAELQSLPEWALTTLNNHVADPRPAIYSLDELAAARTSDPIWNAAQRQLVRDGVIHNYLRMLWGKRILEWTRSPQDALDVLIELNNRYAIDGRNPNSYSGIFWVLGRYDRAWGPQRPIFGKIRYMSSVQTKRKLRLSRYLDEFGVAPRLIPD